MRVQLPPRSTVVALLVKGTSWLPPKEQVQVRLLAGVLRVVSRISSAGSTKPGWQVRLLHDLLVWKGRSRGPGTYRAIAARQAPFPVILVREACGEDQRQARLPVREGTGRCDPSRDGEQNRSLPRRAPAAPGPRPGLR